MTKKLFTCLFVLIFVIVLKTGVVHASTKERIWGNNRYSTAVQVSKQIPSSDYAVIATGDDFPDALCAAPLAKKYNAPILLTYYNNELNTDTINELKNRNVKNVFIIGGTGVVSTNVEQQLKSIGISSNRIGGKNRSETSVKIAETLNSDSIVLTINDNFPDALSISPVAAKNGWPIILTDKSSVDSYVQGYIDYIKKNNSVKTTYVLGSNLLIDDNVARSFPGYSENNRIWGKNRYETNGKIMDKFNSMYDFNKVYVATGNDYPDALVSSSLTCVGNKINPIVLTDEGYFSDNTVDYLKNRHNEIKNVIAIGGTGVVPDVAFNRINGIKIVLDAGHGGSDPGAVYFGVNEKDINLSLTKDIGAILESSGIKIYYTRQDDRLLGNNIKEDLAARYNYANSINPDIFLSIHHNAGGSNSEGISTHYSTYRPNLDNTDIVTDPDNPNIKRDKTPPEAAKKSAVLAQMIVDKLSTLGFRNDGIEDHSLAVTKMTTMPSVLVEAGFMTNRSELDRIKDPNMMKQMAQKIVDAINEYINYYGLN